MFESPTECIAKRYGCLFRLLPDLDDLFDDSFAPAQPDMAMSATGREATLDLPLDSRHPASPTPVASDRHEQGVGIAGDYCARRSIST
jgi:hypothetical protein